MFIDDFEEESRFREAWESIEIARSVEYSLFTFGESVLPYYVVCGRSEGNTPVTISRGEVRVNRPRIITPDSGFPDVESFFENPEEEDVVEFLLARTARFSNLRLAHQRGEKRIVSDSVEEAVAKLNRQLDDEDEDRVAVLTAPPQLGNFAVLRYVAERVMQSGPDNVQELRERGFLP